MKPQCWALVFFGLLGCVTVTSKGVRPDELARLDGYRGGPEAFGAEPEVQTLAGDKVTVRPDSYVFLDLPGAHMGGRFESIAVRDGVFDGRKLDGGRVQVRLDQITSARVDQPNRLAAWAVTAGVLAGAVTILLGTYLFFSLTDFGGIAGRALRVRGRQVAAQARPIRSRSSARLTAARRAHPEANVQSSPRAPVPAAICRGYSVTRRSRSTWRARWAARPGSPSATPTTQTAR